MRYKDFKLTEEQLFEINMGMKNLRQLVKGIDARVGMEFEMIVPDVPKNEDGGEMEVDYDADESAFDISDICRFFHDGDYNSSRQIERLRQELSEQYETWVVERIHDDWTSDEEDHVYEYVKHNVDDDVIAEELGLESDEDGNYPDIGRVEYQEFAAKCVADQNNYYDEAKEQYLDEKRDDYTERDWLENEGLHRMSDVSDNYSEITWPYYTGGGGDETSWDLNAVAQLFRQAVGRPAVAGGDYHALSGKERDRVNSDSYILEIDGSLEPDDDDDAGIEFVSPPLTVEEMISDLAKVKALADEQGCYTSAANKTGLHINISVAGWKGIEGLDYVKLALLLGDEYILSQFERQSNYYCKSAMSIVKDAIQRNPESVQTLLDKMKSQLNTAASKLIHSGTTQKFTSINTKENRIEFRGPGGDWLNEFHDRIEPTLLRMVVALDAAVHEDKYKKEYQKKLYKLLSPTMDEYGTMVKDFSDYVSGVGGAPEQVVKDFRRAALAKLQQQKSKAPEPTQQPTPATTQQTSAQGEPALQWYTVRNSDGFRMDFEARNVNSAMQRAREQYPSAFRDITDVVLVGTTRPATAVSSGEHNATPPTAPANTGGRFTGEWQVLNASGNEVYRFGGAGNSQSDANRIAAQFLQRLNPQINTSEFSVVPVMSAD